MWLLALLITVEHATTPEQCAQGLMHRTHLEADHGMTFNFPSARRRTFWMKNCQIDLDVAFLNDSHTILEIHTLHHRPCESVTSQQPIRYVLEMPSEWFSRHNITVGDQVTWSLNSPTAQVTRK